MLRGKWESTVSQQTNEGRGDYGTENKSENKDRIDSAPSLTGSLQSKEEPQPERVRQVKASRVDSS